MHVIGASGQGKSKALESIIRQDIKAGHGVIVIDPHGSLYDDLVKWLAYHDYSRYRTIHLINPGSDDSTVGFNPLWVRPDEDISRRVDRVVDAFSKVWGGEDTASTPRLARVLTCVFYALAKQNLSIVEGTHLLSTTNQDGLREYLTADLEDAYFQSHWNEYNAYSPRVLQEHFESTGSRFMRFLASPTVRAMLGSKDTPIDFRKCMDNDEIVLINLQESPRLSFANAAVIGSLISNELFSLASSRPLDVAEQHPCYFYIDECYRYLSSDIEDMLNQTRKRGLHVTLVHHYLEQLRQAGDGVYHGVMTNAQTKLVFGGASDADAEILAKEIFRTEFDLEQEKEKLSKPTPTGTFHRETLSTSSESQGHIDGTSEDIGDNSGSGTSVARIYDEYGSPVGGYIETISDSSASRSGSGSFSADTYSETHGTHEVLVPDYAIMPTALKNLEEVTHEAIVKLRALGQRFAILKVPHRRSFYIKIPFVKEPAVTPRTIEAFEQKIFDFGPYTLSRRLALKKIEIRRKDLVRVAGGGVIDVTPEDDENDFLQ